METAISEAENRMNQIERRITLLESGGASDESSNDFGEQALKKYQLDLLVRLKAIREKITVEGDLDSIRKERDVALDENIKMRKEIEKLNYRVKHLVKALNEEESKHS